MPSDARMRIVFFGTPEVAAASLRALITSPHDVVAVVTQPDKPRGRGRTVSASPAKEVAADAGIPVLQPLTPKDERFAPALRAYEPDVLAVVAYGHLLPQPVLEVAPAINVHFSLLPRYRGAAPVQRALMDGATETGVSVFLLEPTMDTGPVYAAERVPVPPDATAGDLFTVLTPLGASLLLRVIDAIEHGTARAIPQDHSVASPAPKIKPDEALIDWRGTSDRIANLVRALNPRPGAWTRFRGKRVTVWRARSVQGNGPPGVVLPSPEGRLVVAAGDGAVELQEVQPEGKRAMAGDAFVRGYHPSGSDRFEGSPG